MNTLKLEIEVNLGEATIDVLKRIAAASIFARLGENPESVSENEEESAEDDSKKETPIDNLPDMPSDEDLAKMYPSAPAEPEKEISDDEIAAATRAVVSALKKQGKSALIVRKEVFAKYGISQSTDCPKDQRAALIADMNALIA